MEIKFLRPILTQTANKQFYRFAVQLTHKNISKFVLLQAQNNTSPYSDNPYKLSTRFIRIDRTVFFRLYVKFQKQMYGFK
jgi:hypothetical protein